MSKRNEQFERVTEIFSAAGGECLWATTLASALGVIECWKVPQHDCLFLIQGYGGQHGGCEIYTNENVPPRYDAIAAWLRKTRPDSREPSELTSVLAGIAQGVINIAEGETTIEKDSRIYRAMARICEMVTNGEITPEMLEAQRGDDGR